MAKYHPIDVHVGKRIRQRRTLLGMSQTRLAKAVGLTFQQVQKYESGANRLGSSRLFEFGKVLDVPVDYFFNELASGDARTPSIKKGGRGRYKAPDRTADVLTKRETLELVRSYFKIRSPTVRRHILSVVSAMGTRRPPARTSRH